MWAWGVTMCRWASARWGERAVEGNPARIISGGRSIDNEHITELFRAHCSHRNKTSLQWMWLQWDSDTDLELTWLKTDHSRCRCWAVFVDGSTTYSYLQHVIIHTHTQRDTQTHTSLVVFFGFYVMLWRLLCSSLVSLEKHSTATQWRSSNLHTDIFLYSFTLSPVSEQEIQLHNTLVLQQPKVECKNLVVMNWIIPSFSFISHGKFSSSILFFGYGAECDIKLCNTWNI